ncbi:hypothetical protein OZX62_09910 [Bifidobacterium sp. ESL0690]|uniref:hypothetical protein n=1 Tax=Bifidobacterium sp. ESL0690 TaxID=2983214 RepID=UPI0023F84DBB|nr:hypothetical protein [Bifidobacterium sp. ESL0690]WEV46720.1 hypothetical protein OZX62_09910 [Bifidobacterium sp. ESL0690]
MFKRIKERHNDEKWHWDDSKAVEYTGEEGQKHVDEMLMRVTGTTNVDAAVQTILEAPEEGPKKLGHHSKQMQFKLPTWLRTRLAKPNPSA